MGIDFHEVIETMQTLYTTARQGEMALDAGEIGEVHEALRSIGDELMATLYDAGHVPGGEE